MDKKDSIIEHRLLKQKIDEGNSNIQISNNQTEAVLFIGDSGVGKSTITNYLIGNQLFAKNDNLKMSLTCSAYRTKISDFKISQTSLPIKVISKEGLVIYDCPGFNDNRSIQAQIANSFYYKRLMQLYQKIKIVVVIDEDYLTQYRAAKMPSLIKKLNNTFGNLSKIKASTLFVINKCDPEWTMESINQQLMKIFKTKNLFSNEQVNFFQEIIKRGNIFTFNRPRKQQKDTYIDGNLRQKLSSKILKLSYMDRTEIRNIISDVGELGIREYFDQVICETEKQVKKMMEYIRQELKRTMKPQEKKQIKKEIMDLLGQKNGIKSDRFQKFLDFYKKWNTDPKGFKFFQQSLLVVQFFSNVYTEDKTKTFYLLITNIITNGLADNLDNKPEKKTGKSRKDQLNDQSKEKQNQLALIQKTSKKVRNSNQSKERIFTNQVIGGSESNYSKK